MRGMKCKGTRVGVSQIRAPLVPHLQVQVDDVAVVEPSHAGQDLPGQPDDILLREGLIILPHALAEDLPTCSTAESERKDGKAT